MAKSAMVNFVNKFYKRTIYKIGLIFFMLSITTTMGHKLKPTHYDIDIHTIIEPNYRIYKGNVLINIQAISSEQEITLNSNVDIINKVEVRSHNDDKNITAGYTIDRDKKIIIANLSTNLLIDELYTIYIQFENAINKGYYGNSFNKNWTAGNYKPNWITATHTQFNSMSSIIPCFCPSEFKSTMNVKMGMNLSATPISVGSGFMSNVGELPSSIRYTFFGRTQPMYIKHFGFAITSHAERTNNVCSAYAHKRYSTKFVLEVCIAAIRYYKAFFRTELSSYKLSLIAIDNLKHDMEIFHGFNYIKDIYFPIRNDTENYEETPELQRSASIVTQSVLHQWMLNANLPGYWDDYWILEGFVQFYHVRALDAIKKSEWTTTANYYTNTQMHSALAKDYFPFSFSLKKNKTNYFTQQNQMILAKSASIMRMMANVLSEKTFKNRLRNIVNQLNYSQSKDFWFEDSVNDFYTDRHLEEWAESKGYPILNVDALDNTTVAFTQVAFNPMTNGKDVRTVWTIPISYTTSDAMDFNSTKFKFVFYPQFNVMKIRISLPVRYFIICNIQQMGYYRVNYGYDLWLRIIEFLTGSGNKISDIHSINRAQLIDDAFHFSLVGRTTSSIPITLFLTLTTYLSKETDYLPWVTAIRHYKYILNSFNNDLPSYNFVKEHFLMISSKIYKDLFNIRKSEYDNSIAELQYKIIDVTCRLDESLCIQTSKRFLKEWRASNLEYYSNFEVNYNTRRIIYCTAIRNSRNEDDLKFVSNIAMKKLNTKEGNRLVAALGCSRNKTFLIEFWKDLANRTNVRDGEIENFNILFRSMSKHSAGVAIIRQVINNWDGLPTFDILLPNIIELLRVSFDSKTSIEIISFIVKHSTLKINDDTFILHDPYYESVANEVFRTRIGPEITDWFAIRKSMMVSIPKPKPKDLIRPFGIIH